MRSGPGSGGLFFTLSNPTRLPEDWNLRSNYDRRLSRFFSSAFCAE
jgi:hypothetical protein